MEWNYVTLTIRSRMSQTVVKERPNDDPAVHDHRTRHGRLTLVLCIAANT